MEVFKNMRYKQETGVSLDNRDEFFEKRTKKNTVFQKTWKAK